MVGSTLRHGSGVDGAAAVIEDAALIYQLLSTADEAQNQAALPQSCKEELLRTANTLSTSAGLPRGDCG
jgi:hypothetical protein